MKRTHTPICYLLLTLLLLMGCNEPKQMTEALNRAEALMDEHPDSALNLLEGIGQSELDTKEYQTRYALLYS